MNKTLEAIENFSNGFIVGISGHSDGPYNKSGFVYKTRKSLSENNCFQLLILKELKHLIQFFITPCPRGKM
jgi:hypothetical protein